MRKRPFPTLASPCNGSSIGPNTQFPGESCEIDDVTRIQAFTENRVNGYQETSAAGPHHEGGTRDSGGPGSAVGLALEQLKPLLALLPELTAKASKSMISLWAGKVAVGYAYPRKGGVPRVRAYVGDGCPDWAKPDPTHAAWCHVDDWSSNLERVAALFREASRRRAEDMTAGRDPYRRREQPLGGVMPTSPQ